MTIMALAALIPVIYLLVAFFVNANKIGYWALVAIVVNALISGYLAINALKGQQAEFIFSGNTITGVIPVKVDGLSAWFIFVANILFVAGIVFAIGYLKGALVLRTKRLLHFSALVFLHSAILGVLTVQNSLVFLIAWEIMALSAFLCLIYESEKISVLKAGINYLVQSHISVVIIMIGFIWVATQTGSFEFGALKSLTSRMHPLVSSGLFLLFFTGFGIKAGFVPLHTWLPHAHPAAPSYISALMSGVLVKMGIYGIFRVMFGMEAAWGFIGAFVLIVSVGGGLYGILNAALHRDIKRVLAYCTIENIGIIGIGLGAGMIGMHHNSPLLYYFGFGGALLHVVNHALFKSLLFFSTGSVYAQTHLLNMDHLGGLAKSMPFTTGLFLIGSLSIVGLPPFNGFVSEFMLYLALIGGVSLGQTGTSIIMILSLGGLGLIGGLALVSFTKLFSTVFLGKARTKLKYTPVEVSFVMLIPQMVIVLVMFTIALWPNLFFKVLSSVVLPLKLNGLYNHPQLLSYTSVMGNITWAAFILVILVMAVWLAKQKLSPKNNSTSDVTWGCGYVGSVDKLQYTGKSFTKSLGKIFYFFVHEKKHFVELEKDDFYPSKRKYLSRYLDFFEVRIYDPLIQRFLFMANYIKFIQNGRVQSYILYGILFVLTVFVATYFSWVRELFLDTLK